jgi:hypothetical protein
MNERIAQRNLSQIIFIAMLGIGLLAGFIAPVPTVVLDQEEHRPTSIVPPNADASPIAST